MRNSLATLVETARLSVPRSPYIGMSCIAFMNVAGYQVATGFLPWCWRSETNEKQQIENAEEKAPIEYPLRITVPPTACILFSACPKDPCMGGALKWVYSGVAIHPQYKDTSGCHHHRRGECSPESRGSPGRRF